MFLLSPGTCCYLVSTVHGTALLAALTQPVFILSLLIGDTFIPYKHLGSSWCLLKRLQLEGSTCNLYTAFTVLQVTLLAAETRLKINLFLNRLEVEPDELVRNLIDSEAQGLTLPLLKYLHNILPCHDEVNTDVEG